MGLAVLDAGVVIGLLDVDDAHHGPARSALAAAHAAGDAFALPASAFAELLVTPVRHGEAAVAIVRQLVTDLPIEVIPIDIDIAVEAARLRARLGTRLRLPDALVVATARVRAATLLLTTDRRWPAAKALGFDGELQRL